MIIYRAHIVLYEAFRSTGAVPHLHSPNAARHDRSPDEARNLVMPSHHHSSPHGTGFPLLANGVTDKGL